MTSVTILALGILALGAPTLVDRIAGAALSPRPAEVRLAVSVGNGEQTIFLQNGRTIQAQGSTVIGNQIRVETPTGTADLPSSEVLSIHGVNPPSASSAPAPGDVYRDLTPQMTDRVREQNQAQSNSSLTK